MTETKVKYDVKGGREGHPKSNETPFNDQLADRLQRILEMKQELEETRKRVTRLDIDINHAEEALNKLLSEDKGNTTKSRESALLLREGECTETDRSGDRVVLRLECNWRIFMTNKGEKFEGFTWEVWGEYVMEFFAENPDLTQEEKDLAIAELHFWEESREWNLNYGYFR